MHSDSTATITTSRGSTVLVDLDDYHMLRHWRWAEIKGYAYRGIGGEYPRSILMHRMIMLPDPDQHVDHINGNKLDNRRCNLRLCTMSQNLANQRSQVGRSSKYKGVCWNKNNKNWLVSIKKNGHQMNVGSFTDEVNAAVAYDLRAIELFGEFARPNLLQVPAL